jgi:uncharacterized protein YdeI (YjbR/CyaY-like superfamily)
MRLNEEGVKSPSRMKKEGEPRRVLDVPDDLSAALAANAEAKAHFDAFSQSKRNDYVEWITEAKTDATRKKRLDTAIEWIAEGKARHWKYEKS